MKTSIIFTKFGNTYNGAEFLILVNGVPLVLTGATLKMQVRFNFKTAVIKEFALGSGLSLTDAVNGKFKFDAQTITIPPGSYQYDILITLANGTKKTYVTGVFIVQPVITHG